MLPAAEYDSPWKEALEEFLQPCLALLLPDIHADVDWARDFHFLDTQLQQVAPEAAVGPRVVDKLIEVRRRDGQPELVLIHIEVQSQQETDFARRMFGYYYRLLDRFDRPVVSVAILGDDRPAWRPDAFESELWGCSVAFRFPVVKLLHFRQRWEELEASTNPFAGVVMAHLRALETHDDAERRSRFKLGLTRWLLTRGYSREEVMRVFRIIDWILRLPEDLEIRYWQQVQAYEEERHVAYITSVERIGMQRGLEQGREEGREEGRREGVALGRREGLLTGLELAFELKFGEEGRRAFEEVRRIEDVATLDAIAARIRTATRVEEVRALYGPPKG